LVEDPEILVLDEPTSALDLNSEILVQQSLASLRGHMTLFVVAHRLSLLSICDRIMVIGNGTVEAFGPTVEIEQTSAFYRAAATLSGTSGAGA
jgi:ABC-type bacteriocin/lantibiotic exporter with double-glycine peptidase domain